ncbi:MAG: HAD family hydrolase [Lentilactobacillus hilgardii]|jgi:putative hydrolase of the HAD superfamily|uniref:HAD-IA family hydrolase n=2 Tax=Lentilactobacillus hilgardii TaxID=1588 RepID=A0A6P1ED62_LENHI|nr:HAD family hydrolase [Lentilactobacillus hilgardii]MCI1922782.1 HAD family hydrolase [Lentilactobacillus buchneri]RRG11382.1 MAG: HAD family hydrolase [Lactobacillus sp.]EEI69959.1 HAD hydrolase, family IA, variant 1 [Lentilactobacillus hilgardii ATCC 27305]MBZ2201859.1 HAD family hydrolase [Lentilactobacillus hilgardii]MBZ2204893.1 HAD family hydrolase [Lentilactobacillus hilgardii]
MIKAIVFDVDDTLYDQKPSFNEAFKQIFSNDVDSNLINKIFSNYVQQEQLVVAKNNLDNQFQLSKTDISFHCLHHSFKEFNLDGLTQKKAEDFWQLYSKFSQDIQLFDGLTHVFNKLIEKFKLGIITNGSTENQLSKITRLNLQHWFDRESIITSEDANAKKPDPMIFTLMNRKFELRGNEMMYVGSSYLNDIVPAKRAGWQTVWYNNHDGSIIDPNIIPDQTVNNSEQLQELLLELAAEV